MRRRLLLVLALVDGVAPVRRHGRRGGQHRQQDGRPCAPRPAAIEAAGPGLLVPGRVLRVPRAGLGPRSGAEEPLQQRPAERQVRDHQGRRRLPHVPEGVDEAVWVREVVVSVEDRGQDLMGSMR